MAEQKSEWNKKDQTRVPGLSDQPGGLTGDLIQTEQKRDRKTYNDVPIGSHEKWSR